MKKNNVLFLVFVACGLMLSHSAQAHGRGGYYRGGFGGWGLSYGFGYAQPFAYGYPYSYPYAYPYYPPVISVPATPPVYIERNVIPPPEPNYWYYCRHAEAYYPYVKECPGGWEKVAPQPANR